ncbi:iron-siderophore ABC transporter substrate-binding protein [Rhodococcus sp. AD45-ID]|uniref:iron-siderophore ABC transporter substrate-binding protein n=1 Tax=unclassified Rhodococcus (in: high G+C Gram-positive bacteria) TaxID=192944 RepID=UPI0005D36BF5|nr:MULTISPECIES: iron-siderophore ABC transporter substrate-binding protein [unclassified Rhodococcus (in: high G+C Gram-positive bacteria)]KJF20009.1 putative siderophore-binding lipoprotein yfiY precursor [Rhodococcus sp. AD45]PSR41130.1 iron-siderophore ABC transporter substrate-binding protein [Rhodococcus sp. AD45-ID]
MTVLSRTTLRRVSILGIAATLLVLSGCSSDTSDDIASSIVRTTTSIAGAGVMGLARDTASACPTPTAADAGAGPTVTRQVAHTAGTAEVPSDPARIVVLDSASMDAVCALGLWERVVGAATGVDSPQPSYLGFGISEIPSVGPVSAPDVAAIKAAAPDLILGSSPASADLYGQLTGIAPTVFAGSDPVYWKSQFALAGQALGRSAAAAAALDGYQRDARELGESLNSAQTQASVVRFDSDSLNIEGPASFSGQILSDVGVRRPPAQRLTDTVTAEVPADDLSAAEGDLIYVLFDGPNGLKYGTEVMKSDQWHDLGAPSGNRVFVAEDEIWNGNGMTAARAVLDDLQHTLNGYAS